MDSVVDVRECMWCHEPYRLSDGRYKYCSDECAEKAALAYQKKISASTSGKNKRRTERSRKLDDDAFLAIEWKKFCEKYRRNHALSVDKKNLEISGAANKFRRLEITSRKLFYRF